MGWLVIALGSALSAIGAMAMWFGWDIVLNERGWTQVISGSVGLAGGIVTIALGLILNRLGGVRRDLMRVLRERPTAVAVNEKPAELLSAPERPPTPDGAGVPGRKRRKDIASGPRAPLPPDLESEAVPVTAAFAPTLGSSGALAGVAAIGSASSEDLTPAGLAASIHPEEHAPTVAPDEQRTLQDEPRQDEPHPPAGEASGLRTPDDTLTKAFGTPALDKKLENKPERESRSWAPVERSGSFSYDRFEEELARLDQVESAVTHTPEPEPALAPATPPLAEHAEKAAKFEPAPPAQPAPDAVPTSPIVGQYEAGGVSYIMYADGSIEADTASGVYRFVDINELKAFIQNQGSQ